MPGSGGGAWWRAQMSETKDSQAQGQPAVQRTETLHLGLEVCGADDFEEMGEGRG